jgi:hypothetical protein
MTLVLTQSRAHSKSRGISGDDERKRFIRKGENRGRRDRGFEGIEGSLMRIIPGPLLFVLKEGGQRRGDFAEVVNKAAIVVGEAMKRANFRYRSWSWPLEYRFNFVLFHTDSSCTNDMTQERNLSFEELTLARFRIQFILPQQLQHRFNMPIMICLILAEYQDVIEEHNNKRIQLRSKDGLH